MTVPAGYNRMRWECEKDGCFNQKRRPKIEVFADCFPGRINFGDVDGMVEISGHFCLLEWKGEGGSLKRGQERSFENFSRPHGNVVFVVSGNAETMEVDSYLMFWEGRRLSPVAANLDNLKRKIAGWSRAAYVGFPQADVDGERRTA